MVRRREREAATAPAKSTRVRIGSVRARASSSRNQRCALVMSADWKIVNCALTAGILSARAKPLSCSLVFTVLMIVARLTLTVLPETVMAPPFFPSSTPTICAWAERLASSQADLNASVLTSASTCLCT